MIILSANILNFNFAAMMQRSDRWQLINKRRLPAFEACGFPTVFRWCSAHSYESVVHTFRCQPLGRPVVLSMHFHAGLSAVAFGFGT